MLIQKIFLFCFIVLQALFINVKSASACSGSVTVDSGRFERLELAHSNYSYCKIIPLTLPTTYSSECSIGRDNVKSLGIAYARVNKDEACPAFPLSVSNVYHKDIYSNSLLGFIQICSSADTMTDRSQCSKD